VLAGMLVLFLWGIKENTYRRRILEDGVKLGVRSNRMKKYVIGGVLSGLIYLKWGFINAFIILFVYGLFSIIYRVGCRRLVKGFDKKDYIKIKALYIHKESKTNLQLDLGILFLTSDELIYMSALGQKRKVAIPRVKVIKGEVSSIFLNTVKKMTISADRGSIQFLVLELPEVLKDFIGVNVSLKHRNIC